MGQVAPFRFLTRHLSLTAHHQTAESLIIYVSFIFYFFYSNQDEPEKWLRRGYEAKDEENFAVATQCLTYSLLFCPMKNITLLSTLYALRAETNYRMTRILEARKDIAKCRKVDPALVKVCVNSSPRPVEMFRQPNIYELW